MLDRVIPCDLTHSTRTYIGLVFLSVHVILNIFCVMDWLTYSIFILVFLSARAIQQEHMGEQYLVSPITGEKIPADKVQHHMKIGK